MLHRLLGIIRPSMIYIYVSQYLFVLDLCSFYILFDILQHRALFGKAEIVVSRQEGACSPHSDPDPGGTPDTQKMNPTKI